MKALKYLVGIFVTGFLLMASPLEFGRDVDFFHGYIIQRPVIKVGLVTGLKQAVIKASAGMKIYEVGREYRLLAEETDEVVIRVDREKLSEKFSLQIAQSRDRQEAEILASNLNQKLEGGVTVSAESDLNGTVYVTKYGEFLTRGQALEAIHRLETLGLKDIWILKENISLPEPGTAWLQIEHRLLSLGTEADLYFIPAHQEGYLSLDGRNYRGIFLLKNTSSGLSLVNILNLEDYLKGVVPLELSPDTFNALEALKAQAVAARTYALKNLGRYRHLGFDLTDTQSSQVYGGLSAERPLSNQAVEETAGEVITYKGQLIDALYTSTCGGMTEDAENVFSGKPVPYLKSTNCSLEKQPEWLIETRQPVLSAMINDRDITSQITPLLALGLIVPENEPDYFARPVSVEEIESSLAAASALKKINKHQTNSNLKSASVNFIDLSRWLIAYFGWQEKAANFVLESEAKYLLQDSPQLPELNSSDRKGLAYLIQSGILPSYLRQSNLKREVSRAEWAYILEKSLNWLDDFFCRGLFISAKDNLIEVMDSQNQEKRWLVIQPDLYLLRKMEEGTFPANRLNLLGGEKITWLEKDGRLWLLQVDYPPNTNVLDRNSIYNRWTMRVGRDELEKNIRRYYPRLGRLVDLKVIRRGKSNRVASLQITGDGQQVNLTGLRIKWVLNLKDTLFYIDREYDANGQLTHFIFTGRGWGHGVGLCQVGAYGLARSGASYKNILGHYYHQVKIEKIN
ncbi:MAG TPA: SpoIID/LytB domain-containing protein [Candidatus Saccharicenans sp.]|jgi:stage II sporulation protein D|nr:SpoIID/LytB domain-containing protein [Candidatus Saccharicenans sp.]